MTLDMDRELKTWQAQDMPQELASELTAMRRLPANYTVKRTVKCRFGREGAFLLVVAATGVEAGIWCRVHGWTFFDSATNLPTERLTPGELADRRLAASRRAKVARRKENTNG